LKLISVKILGDDFRSLSANTLYKFNHSLRDDRLSTKVFAGLNGSGKSNFLELFSEIFYYLEIYHLPSVSKTEKKASNFGFEIEYFLPAGQHIRIIKPLNDVPEFIVKEVNAEDFIRVDKNTERLLPTKVIAYTSGQNELLSNPYHKLKYHYFKELEKQQRAVSLLDNHRLFFLDYSTNFSVFVANMLLADSKKLNYLKTVLNIRDLQAFRITLNTDELFKKVIPVNDELAHSLQKLKLCSTTWAEKTVGKYRLLIMDFMVTKATQTAFAYHFQNAFNLFKVFYELEIFNLFLVDKKTRDLMLRVHKTYNFSDEIPKPDPSRLVFRMEKIQVDKVINQEENKTRTIYYKALSDGEHQFNEVIGTVLMMEQEGGLFLIDEPDTHFNPKWRAKLIQMLNLMAAETFDANGNVTKVRRQEIIVTTHSPFVISDSAAEDVYCFEKKNGIIAYSNPDIQTYGASILDILDEIFEKRESISEMAKKELKEMIENVTTIDQLRAIITRLNTEFGDSVEKFDLFSKIRNIKEQIERNNA
jgi:restriction system-associated AAA family ATPase